jgi:hypothetical protein
VRRPWIDYAAAALVGLAIFLLGLVIAWALLD